MVNIEDVTWSLCGHLWSTRHSGLWLLRLRWSTLSASWTMVCASWSKVSAIWLWVNWNVGKLTCWRRDLNDNNIFLWIQIPLAKTKRTRSVRRTKHVFLGGKTVENWEYIPPYSSFFILRSFSVFFFGFITLLRQTITQFNLVLSTELMMQIDHRKEFLSWRFKR